MNKLKEWIAELMIKSIRFDRMKRIRKFIDDGVLSVGEHTYGVNNLEIHEYKGSEAKVIIGKYCSIGPNVTIITGGIHPIDRISTYPFRIRWKLPGRFKDGFPSTNGNIEIGNDVWIASSVIILSGISIGHGAVVAAGSVVTKDVSPYAIVGGNPAKVIRFRFEEEKIAQLLEEQWWDFDKEKLFQSIKYLND